MLCVVLGLVQLVVSGNLKGLLGILFCLSRVFSYLPWQAIVPPADLASISGEQGVL